MSDRLFGTADIAERLIVENDLAFAFPSNLPIVSGHTLIVPKRQVLRYEELTQDERSAFEDLREKVRGALIRAFGAEGFNYAWNEGAAGGQSVPHLHLHVIPRKPGDAGVLQYEPREFLYRPGSRAQSPDIELSDIARLIRESLA